ncbi:hypothetical protein RM572_26910 [Streptomyces sp. DSM 42041]|uniref:HNH endonuclease n=1 Tax=Streptomyces hazeniae TaxID=3075538 RepID=A0ABU2NZI3_9ACTN|nr:hypothetical protein [Streptomyces sp. DSM 42041]MDT0382395.1 hypothetical protein [Streptomyces sp. DSM 42041]
MSDERAELLAHAGTCALCEEYAAERMTVAMVQGNSGPGWSRYACLPCARLLVASAFAPQWLREDVARLDKIEAATR